jgi:23S rRNA (uracil1939-C5)-methyltransferase
MKKRSSPPDANAGPQSPVDSPQPARAVIETIGNQGDGIARLGGRKVHVPFTLPGETVCVEPAGARPEAVAIESPSPDRIEPVCAHFGTCGGCSLQHWRDAPYREWKANLVRAALARESLDAPIEPLRSYPIPSRRRAVFTASRQGGRVKLGFNAARSHDLVDIAECPILLPHLSSALPHLREALREALPNGGEAKVHVTAAANGLDCSIEAAKLPAQAAARLAPALSAAGIIRIAWNGEIVFLKAAPFVLIGGVKVALPQGAFLQAVEACEQDMAAFAGEVLAETKTAKGPVCDLFAGLGAFTVPCAKQASVTAFEENAEAVSALASGAKGAAGLKPVKAVRRDLFRNPLGLFELNAFAAAVADPPREGAEAQCRALAASRIGVAAMLSCNPVTFARDAAILTAGGFKLARVAVFDQFKFSAHVEIGAAFVRPGGKKGRLAPALK